MTGRPDITVSELRSAIGRILDAVEERFGPDLRFAVDYYWDVPVPAAFELSDPPELGMGQVSDDVSSVREFLAQDAEEYVVIQHECEHYRGLLQAIQHLDMTPR
jgi:hypothetical protein